MARLLNWPLGLSKVAYQRLSGPRAAGAASSESLSGFIQTVSSVVGSWRYQLTLRSMRGSLFRRYRGMATALHGGANAVRVPFCDPDIMSWADSGVNATSREIADGVTCSNGKPLSNGKNWRISRPSVSVSVAAAKGDTTISLTDEHWGNSLLGGEWIGFFPFHFGKYEITEVIDDGNYRIWPPLRKALTTDSYATLNPVMAMRLTSETGASIGRGARLADSSVMTLVEVQDQDVRDYFADTHYVRRSGGFSLREDGGFALREDGGFELRE